MLRIINSVIDAHYLWGQDCGNTTYAINYPLDENSTVIDLGGYYGVWANQIIEKYNPYMVLVEPIPVHYSALEQKYQNNPKVTLLNYGVSTLNDEGVLYSNQDSTSKYIVSPNPIIVKFITISEILKIINKEHIDLMQINIEGEEYPLLEQMIENGTILKFSNLQIQYHEFINNAEEKRQKIQEKMYEHFDKIFDYPFVFEGWRLKQNAI